MLSIFESTRSQLLFHAARSRFYSAFCWVGLVKTSSIDPSVRQELERRGVDSVRAMLSRMGDGPLATWRSSILITLPGLEISRGDAETWLNEQNAAAARRARFVTILTFVGTVAAIIAAVPVVLEFFGLGKSFLPR